MKQITAILLILFISINANAYSPELSSTEVDNQSNTSGMNFSGTEFQNILIDIAIVAGIYLIGKQMPKDKQMHFYVGAITGAAAGKWCESRNEHLSRKEKRKKIFLCTLGSSTIVGVLKEAYDSTGRGNVEFADAAVTSAGGAAATLLFL